MSGLPHSTPRGRAVGLAREDVHLVDRSARRLVERLQALLAACPPDGQHASGLARLLKIDRTTCQRAVFAVTHAYPGPQILKQLPGPKALQALVDAARKLRPAIDESVVAALEVAVDEYSALIKRLGGMVSRVIRRLEQSAEPEPLPTDRLAVRRRLHDAAAELTGRSSRCWVAVYIYAPHGGAAGMLDLVRAHGLIGHVAQPDAVPLTFHNFSARPETADTEFFAALDGSAATGRAQSTLLRAFTSDPPPIISAKLTDEFLVQAIDGPAGVQPADLMLASRATLLHPALQPQRLEEAWAMINFPVQHLLFDIYLHEDLARACIPAVDVHLWRPDFAADIGDRWQTRFADTPHLQLLGRGLRNAGAAAYGRQAELATYVFKQAGLDARRFVGLRCEETYPMWRVGYRVSLDFGQPTAAQ